MTVVSTTVVVALLKRSMSGCVCVSRSCVVCSTKMQMCVRAGENENHLEKGEREGAKDSVCLCQS